MKVEKKKLEEYLQENWDWSYKKYLESKKLEEPLRSQQMNVLWGGLLEIRSIAKAFDVEIVGLVDLFNF